MNIGTIIKTPASKLIGVVVDNQDQILIAFNEIKGKVIKKTNKLIQLNWKNIDPKNKQNLINISKHYNINLIKHVN